jgi:hypothetical protein
MKDDPLYKLMGQWLVQTPEVRASKISTATWLARFTPIGNVLTADQYLKAHDIKEFEGGRKCKMCGLPKLKGKGLSYSRHRIHPVEEIPAWKIRTKAIFDYYMESEDWRMLIIDNIGNTRQQKIKQTSINRTIFLYIERQLLDEGIAIPNRDDLLQYIIQLMMNWVNSLSLEVQDPSGPEPGGQGKYRKGKGKLSKLNKALSEEIIVERKLRDGKTELRQMKFNLDFIDPDADEEYEDAQEQIEVIRGSLRALQKRLKDLKREILKYYEDGINEPVNVRPTDKPLPGPSRLRPKDA